jgi:gliding motility-associated-like protein
MVILLLFLGWDEGVAQPTVDVAPTTATCGNNNGKLAIVMSNDNNTPFVVTITGGTPAVTVTVNTSTSTNIDSAYFSNLYGGSYAITVTDNAGNTTGTPGFVSDIPGPSNVILDPETPASCLNNDGVVAITVSGGTVPFTFTSNGSTVGTTSGPTGTASGLPSGPVTIVVRDGNGCLVPPQTVTIPLNDNLTLQMGTGVTICQGTSTPISITSNATSFSWSPASGLSSTTVEDPTASPSVSTTYTVSAALGICPATGTFTVAVLPAPVADAGAPDTICSGKAVYLQGSGGVQYFWTPTAGLSNPRIADPLVIDPLFTTTYSLSVVDGNGCKSLEASTMTLTVLPPYRVFAGNDTSVMVGQTVPLNAVDVQGVGFDQYAWSPVAGLSNPSIADPTASFTATGIYTYVVTATAPNGCEGSASITITVYALADIFVPNAFTPNNDGHNDVLRAIPVSIRDFKYLTVFNRWGQQVFMTTNPGTGWDGTFNGHELPADTYVWMTGGVDYTGRVVERKGTVILIR